MASYSLMLKTHGWNNLMLALLFTDVWPQEQETNFFLTQLCIWKKKMPKKVGNYDIMFLFNLVFTTLRAVLKQMASGKPSIYIYL